MLILIVCALYGIWSVFPKILKQSLEGEMAALIDGHLRYYVLDPSRKSRPSQLEATDELMSVGKRYLS